MSKGSLEQFTHKNVFLQRESKCALCLLRSDLGLAESQRRKWEGIVCRWGPGGSIRLDLWVGSTPRSLLLETRTPEITGHVDRRLCERGRGREFIAFLPVIVKVI